MILRALVLLAATCWASAAAASVESRFHSKDFGATFPHACLVLHGTLDSTGEAVDANYGFTVRHLIGPSILHGREGGVWRPSWRARWGWGPRR